MKLDPNEGNLSLGVWEFLGEQRQIKFRLYLWKYGLGSASHWTTYETHFKTQPGVPSDIPQRSLSLTQQPCRFPGQCSCWSLGWRWAKMPGGGEMDEVAWLKFLIWRLICAGLLTLYLFWNEIGWLSFNWLSSQCHLLCSPHSCKLYCTQYITVENRSAPVADTSLYYSNALLLLGSTRLLLPKAVLLLLLNAVLLKLQCCWCCSKHCCLCWSKQCCWCCSKQCCQCCSNHCYSKQCC